ncbi:MAG TPA: site-specific integrase [Bryobacteraceae bacterium]|nr:site-specific integrase [Bryobacteraceae bacterium]
MVYKRGRTWWYKFIWNGEPIRESTKQSNKRVAEQIESARKTQFAKGEVGIRDKKPVPTLREFAETDFLPFVRSTFGAKQKTLSYYANGTARLLEYRELADAELDEITGEQIAGFAQLRRDAGLKVASINRELQALRRMFALATEWRKVEKALPRVKMIPGEAHRERILSAEEEQQYLEAATALGEAIVLSYSRALDGIRAVLRDEVPLKPRDPLMLRDVGTLLLDCGLRPEECFRLKWDQVRDGVIEIHDGKTENARRRIPLSQRASGVLAMRRTETSLDGWVFPAPTISGHIEPSSLKKQHDKACQLAKVAAFPLYTFRHTCLTRWAPHMDPWTLAYLAGHRDMSITKRYVHPQEHATRAAMEKAREVQTGHKSGHKPDTTTHDKTAEGSVIN